MHMWQPLKLHRRFVRAITHEIRTPLSTAFMGLEMLKDELMDVNNDLQRKDLLLSVVEIREACDITLTILNDLLISGNVNTSDVELERKLVDIYTVLENNVGLFTSQVPLN